MRFQRQDNLISEFFGKVKSLFSKKNTTKMKTNPSSSGHPVQQESFSQRLKKQQELKRMELARLRQKQNWEEESKRRRSRPFEYFESGIDPYYEEMKEEKVIAEETINHDFKPGDIVYLKWSPNASPIWPSVNTDYECDLKILILNKNTAEMISGRGLNIVAKIKDLIPAKEKHLYSKLPLVSSQEDTELFPKGTVFQLTPDGYLVNDSIGIYILRDRVPQEIIKPLN